MVLQAFVRERRNTAQHLEISSEGQVQRIDFPALLQIEPQSNGSFLLLRLDLSGGCLADTWHENLASAMAQAEFEYGTLRTDWRSKD